MLLELLEAVTGIFVVVYDGKHALKFTLGRAQGVVGPGVHFKLPVIQKFQVEETKHTTLDLEPQVIQLNDGLVYEVDAKLMYQIVDLRKAVVEIDDLVTGLQNRVVLAVQRIVGSCDRETILDTDTMVRRIRDELRPVEEQWGVRVLQFGFSNISPSPTTLEITQLDLLARERLLLYRGLVEEGLAPAHAVALVTGAVIATTPPVEPTSLAAIAAEEQALAREVGAWAEAAEQERRKAAGREGESEDDETEEGGEERET
jgi:regulator of protease activity HflC (stomatin/prohibitin superfamily)